MDINMISDEVRVLTEDAVLLAESSGDERLPKAARYLRQGKIAETLHGCAPFWSRIRGTLWRGSVPGSPRISAAI